MLLASSLWALLEAAAVLTLLGATVAVVLLYCDPAVRRNLAVASQFPQPRGVPVIGHLLLLLRSREDVFGMLRRFRRTLGSRFVITMLGRTVFAVSDPQAVEAVLSSSRHMSKGVVYELLKPWLGLGLLTSGGGLWRSRRKLLTPAFHFRILDQFSQHLEQQARGLADELDAARRAAADRGHVVDVVPVISGITLRAIRVTAMGAVDFETDSSPDLASEKSYFDAIHRVGTTTVARLVRPWLWPAPVFKLTGLYRSLREDLRTLHAFTAQVIAGRKRVLFEEGSQPAPDDAAAGDGDDGDDRVGVGRRAARLRPFLDVLLHAQRDGADLTDKNIREEVDTFMFEGHDTTSMALSWALELLGRHPAAQDRLAAELRGAAADWEAVSRLPYLDRVVKECLRLRPSVPVISRTLDSDAVLDNKQVLPARAVVTISIYELHRHPDFFPEPDRFDPDRFLPEREHARHPFAYVPFSAGPRNCIGKRFALMEVKLLLAAVVRAFRVRSAMADGEDMFIADLVLRPRAGVFLELTPR